MNYAGFWLRLIAYILDMAMLSLLGYGVAVIFFLMSFPEVLAQIVLFGLAWVYYAVMESSSTQATVGKMAVGLKVVDEKGNRISFARASGRFFGKIVSAIIVFIGFLMVAFTKKKQGLHDIMAECLVIRGE